MAKSKFTRLGSNNEVHKTFFNENNLVRLLLEINQRRIRLSFCSNELLHLALSMWYFIVILYNLYILLYL